MNYDNSTIRRQDSLLDEERARELLLKGEFGFLAMASAEGGYGVPISYVLSGDTIYLHCASEGRKLRAMEHDERVSFCVVGDKHLVPEEFTTEYESVMAFGRARVVEQEQEKHNALKLIVEKYSPAHIEEGLRVIARLLHRTTIVAIDFDSFSGKRK